MNIAWLLDVVRLAFDFIPRPHCVAPDEARVSFIFGKYVRDRRSGVYIEWPLVNRYETVLISEDTVAGEITHEGRKRRWEARYRVVDPVESILGSSDIEESTRTFVNLFLAGEDEEMPEDLAETVNEENTWGVEIIQIGYTDDGIFVIDTNG